MIVFSVCLVGFTFVTSLVKPPGGENLFDPVVGYLLYGGFLIMGVVLTVQGLSRRAELKRLSELLNKEIGSEALTQRQPTAEGDREPPDVSIIRQLPDPAVDEFITAQLDKSAKELARR